MEPTQHDINALAERIDRLVASQDALVQSRRWDRRVVVVLAAAVALLVVVVVILAANLVGDQRQQKDIDAANRDRRIANRAIQYGGCLDDNKRTDAVDRSYQVLAAEALSSPDRDAFRTSRALDGFRAGLTIADCDSILSDLTAEEEAETRQRAAHLPRRALPPPTVPGYVP